MTGFVSLATAMAKGFIRDRMAMFFAILFPLMFLVLFAGLFNDEGDAPKSSVIQVGDVALLDDAPKQAKESYDEVLDISKSDDLDAAIADVREGDADAVITQQGDTIHVDYTAADQVGAATLQGVLQSIVQSANVQATGEPPTFNMETDQVEDESLTTVQYMTPGLLGWAIAMGATFGAAANLVVWRKNGMLRRLRLAPIPTSSIVLSRVVVSIGIAALQTVIFVSIASAFFGLQMTGGAWLSIPLLVCGTLSFMAIGLLAGSVSKTEEGATGLANFVILPMAFLSGSFFPLDEAPGWLQAVSQAFPLKHLNDGMLDVMVRGEGVAAIVGPCAFLLAIAAVLTAISARLFRWDAT
ncbi:ABC transporter permease [Solicola gregarius]|uniref:Transport permease protein n=1 Tax=Solicola gregarius TaxID=2908642 RepID=A0AA46YJ89_9ACTN|nr:ABC transporter permease [Solicola gregarius]UYM04062.1 ABC transporter permease [Solicola gregarius]